MIFFTFILGIKLFCLSRSDILWGFTKFLIIKTLKISADCLDRKKNVPCHKPRTSLTVQVVDTI